MLLSAHRDLSTDARTAGMMAPAHRDCPACGGPAASQFLFYEARRVPVHSVLLMPTRAEALSFPQGDIRLAFCRTCGLISNTAFDPRTQAFSARYEETQGFSPTYQDFAHSQAEELIERYDLRGKEIIEIGCGKGEFLSLLCALGDNRGIGFDPAYVEGRADERAGRGVTFIRDLYSEKYAGYRA